MRILLLNHNVAYSGGTFFRAYSFGRHLARRGHEVTLLSISASSRWRFMEHEKEGLYLVETPDLLWGIGRTGWDPWDTWRRIGWLKGKSFDIIHAFDSRPVVILPGLFLKQSRQIPLVLDWADWWGRGGTIEERPSKLLKCVFGPVETFFEEAFRVRAQGTTVISRALFERAVKLGVPRKSILYIPQGSDVHGIVPLNRREARSKMRLPKEDPIIGHLGVLLTSDARLLFQTFQILRRRIDSCRLILIGKHKTKVHTYLTDCANVIETGYVSYEDLGYCLCACDVLLLPLKDTTANRGRWPSKVNDYIAAGRPIVSSAVGEMSRLLRENRIGLLADDNPHDLAEKIILLLRDSELRDSLGNNARTVATEKFAWELLTGRLEEFYSKVVANSPGAA